MEHWRKMEGWDVSVDLLEVGFRDVAKLCGQERLI